MKKKRRLKIRTKMLKSTCAVILSIVLTIINLNVDAITHKVSAEQKDINSVNNEFVITEAQKKEAKEQDEKLKKYVKDTKESKEQNKKAKVIKELKKLRTSDSSTYLLSDGSRKLEIYSQDIYYKENGEYVDYDPSLKVLTKTENKELLKKDIVVEDDANEYAYVNTAGDSKHYFPKALDEDNAIILTKKNHEISFVPVRENDVEEKTLDSKENVEQNVEETTILDNAENSNIEESSEADSLLCIDNESVKEDHLVYSGEQEKISYKYTSLTNGVKEEIILDEKPDTNIFEFKLNLPGMIVKANDYSKELSIFDKETKKMVAYICEPNIKDADGNVTYDDIHYEIEKVKDGEYILKVVVNEDYLNSEKTTYPISLDPTVLWASDRLESVSMSDLPYTLNINTKHYNTFRIHNKGIKYSPYSTSVEHCYIDTSGIDTDYTFSGSTATFYGSDVEEAYLTITETGNSYQVGSNGFGTFTSGAIDVRTPVSTWDPDTITWNNHPDIGNTVWSQFTTTGQADKQHRVELTDWAQALADRNIENTGLALTCVEEGTGAGFYTASLDNSGKYMTLTIVYENPHIGEKGIYSYEDFSTPNGTGQIELSQGNFLYSQTDLSLPTPQLPLEVTRTYNSRNTEKSSFGIGWNSEYDSYVIPNGSRSIIYVDGTKTFYEFGLQQGTNWVCNENTDLSIEIGSTSQTRVISAVGTTPSSTVNFTSYYIITDKDKVKRYFSEDGKLRLIEEANGTFIYVKYHNTYGFIQSVYSSKGQKIDFEYAFSGGDYFVNKITLADNSSFNYTYTNSRLTKVVHKGSDNGEIEYNYEYNSNGQLSKIVDAEDNEYQIEYDARSVSSAIYPDDSRIDIYVNYQPLKTRVIALNANNMVLHYKEYEFDERGQVITEKDSLGNLTTFSYNECLLENTEQEVEYHKIENNKVLTVVSTGEEGDTHLEQTIEYDERNNIKKEVDEEGNETEYKYDYEKDEEGNFINPYPDLPIKVITKNGSDVIEEVEYSYDDKGNLIKEIDYIENLVTTYSYEGNDDGNPTISTETLVDSQTNMGSVSDSTISNGLTNYTDTTGYDIDGKVVEGSYTSGTINQTEENVYDTTGLGRLISTTDEKDRITSYSYDEFGRDISTEITFHGSKLEETAKAYDLNGKVIEETENIGSQLERKTAYVYDDMGRIVSETITCGDESRTTTTTYGYVDNFYVLTGTGTNKRLPTVEVVTVKNSNNTVVSQTYTDPYGKVVREEINGICTDYTYDKQGNVFTTYTRGVGTTNTTDAKLVLTVYDKYGRLTDTIQNPVYRNGAFTVDVTNSILTSNTYDKDGNLIKETDAKGNETTYEYDEEGRLTKVSLEDGTGTANETLYAYGIQNKDEYGNIISTTDKTTNALGNISETIMNGAGQVLSVEDKHVSNSIKTTYEYDTSGNVKKEIKSDGSYFTYAYNDKELLMYKYEYNTEGVWSKLTGYSYNDDKQLTRTIDYNAINNSPKAYRYTIYEYDAFKRMIGYSEINTSKLPTNEEINENKVIYKYDIEDKLIEVRYPKSSDDKLKGIKLEYNDYKWLVKIKGIISENDTEVTRNVREYEYYNDSKIKTIKEYIGFLNNTNGYIQKSYEYDVFDRTTKMSYADSSNLNTVIEQHTYSYDKNSNIVSETFINNYPSNQNEKVNETRSYTYDNLNRMVTSKIIDNFTQTESNTTYTYDKVGNCTQIVKDGVTTNNTYNSLNQLTQSEAFKDGSRVYLTFYTYDANGNQILEQTMENPPTIVETVQKEYDANNQLVKVTGRDGTISGTIEYTQENTYNSEGQRILKKDNDVTTYYYYQGSVLLYTTDSEGNKTSQNVVGPQENIIATIRYEEEGQSAYFYNKDIRTSVTNILDDTGVGVVSYKYDDYGTTTKYGDTDFYNEICYTSGVYDEITSLYYLNARYYNPNTATFITQDSYRGEQDDYGTWNLYAYCAGNPIVYVDPSGHKKKLYNSGYYLPAQAWDSLREVKIKESTYYGPKKARNEIYRYLTKQMKVTREEACAILGNIYVETWHTYSSWSLQGSQTPSPSYVYRYDAYDSKGWGILQWTYYSRKEALKKYVTTVNKKNGTKGLDVGDLIVQLEFFNYERKGTYKKAWKNFKNANGIQKKVKVFCNEFEQAGKAHMNTRIKIAKKLNKSGKF